MVAPGVAFVFADKELEQRFNAGRYRTSGIATRLLAARVPRVRQPRIPRERVQRQRAPSRAEQQFSFSRPSCLIACGPLHWTLADCLSRTKSQMSPTSKSKSAAWTSISFAIVALRPKATYRGRSNTDG